jgi:lipopolysaccharide/colanic/teichoic acid biosynthesis glycosyltransferase
MSNSDLAAEAFRDAGPGFAPLGYAAARRRRRPPLRPMPWDKRAFDIAVAGLLLLVLWPLLLATAVLLLLFEGRPVFYVAERMGAPGRTFRQWKFRTMRVGADAAGGVTGGDKAKEISRLHRILRRSRLDELPQLWNVLRGDMSLVGPRPPMKRYVELYPDLYARVLQSRPGLTGLATLRFHLYEERLLAACATAEETDAVYRRACIRQKARLDLIYQRRRTLWLDICLVAETALKPFRRPEPPPVGRTPKLTRAMRRLRPIGRQV